MPATNDRRTKDHELYRRPIYSVKFRVTEAGRSRFRGRKARFGSAWSETTPNPSPAARGYEAGRPALTYDSDRHAVLLCGGFGSGTYFNGLWAWEGGNWAKVG
jgi:hypothetical protein